MTVDYVVWIMNIPSFSFFYKYLVKIINRLPALGKKKLRLFLGHCKSEVFETLHDYNLA